MTDFSGIESPCISAWNRTRSRIAMVIPDLVGGGAERFTLDISQALAERGHRVDVLLFKKVIHYSSYSLDGIDLIDLSEQPALNSDSIPATLTKRDFGCNWESALSFFYVAKALRWRPHLLPSAQLMRMAFLLADYLERVKPDFLMAHLRRAHLVSFFATEIIKSPPIFLPVVHGTHGPQNRRFGRYHHVFSKAARVIAVSNFLSAYVVRSMQISHSNIEVIHNGINLEYIKHHSMEVPNHPWYRQFDTPIVLGVGRLHPNKDFFTLLRAFSLLRRRMKCRLVILGFGTHKDKLAKLATELKIDTDVDFPGFSGNPYSYMRYSTVLGCSSVTEGLSLVLLEALACGCPIVSTDCGGPREVLANGSFGTLVPVGDYVIMANALERAIRQPPDKNLLQQRAETFSMKRCVSAYERVMTEATQESILKRGYTKSRQKSS